jgi:hypothetical protein
VDFWIVLLVIVASVVGLGGQFIESRRWYLQYRGQKSYSYALAFFAAIPVFLFLIADSFDMLPARVYFWVLFLGLLWVTLRHERLRLRMAGDDPKSFVPPLTEKLAELNGWVFAGAVLGLLLLFALQLFTPAEIGTARAVLVRLMAFLKFLKVGGGATILLLGGVLIAQWRFPKWKERLERLWKHWAGGQKYLKWSVLVMTSLFCFSYTGTFRGGAVTPLTHKIDMVEQNYRDMVWQAEIELSADLRIEAYLQAYDSFPAQLQSAIQGEIATGKRAAQLPAKYLPAGFVGYSGHLPSEFQSDGDARLDLYSETLDGGKESDHPDVPDDVPLRGLLWENGVMGTPHRDAIPNWLMGLPGELADKIVDRALDVGNISFVEEFSNEFPLIGSLIGTVDGQLNSALTEKVKAAAGRIAHRRVREESYGLGTERDALALQMPKMRTGAALQSHVVESRAIVNVVARAEQEADTELRVAIRKELQGTEHDYDGREITSRPEEEKASREKQKTVEELTEKYRYDYLLQIRESPESAYRTGPLACCGEHESLQEHEAPRVRPEPVMPHEIVP